MSSAITIQLNLKPNSKHLIVCQGHPLFTKDCLQASSPPRHHIPSALASIFRLRGNVGLVVRLVVISGCRPWLVARLSRRRAGFHGPRVPFPSSQ
jgi:hypothetical protein